MMLCLSICLETIKIAKLIIEFGMLDRKIEQREMALEKKDKALKQKDKALVQRGMSLDDAKKVLGVK